MGGGDGALVSPGRVGAAVVGSVVGSAVGSIVGCIVGSTVGSPVGCTLGSAVGSPLGCTVGSGVAPTVGGMVGAVGGKEGANVGASVKWRIWKSTPPNLAQRNSSPSSMNSLLFRILLPILHKGLSSPHAKPKVHPVFNCPLL